MTTRRLLIANLDAETEFAKRACPGPIPELSTTVGSLISHLGTLMRVFADGPSHVWTPVAVDAALVPEAEHIPSVTFVSGPRPVDDPDALWWSASSEAALQGADRRRALTIATELGVVLPGTTIIESLPALIEAIAALAARTSNSAEIVWVLKAPFSASGRERVRRRGADLDDATQTRVQRLLTAYGSAVFEPWKRRVVDAGCAGTIASDGAVIVATPHVTLNDDGGVFRGISTGGALAGALSARELIELLDVGAAVGRALSETGLRGPFGIDAFAYEDDEGERRFHPLCEINPRHTFGHVAHRLAELTGGPIELHLGKTAMDGTEALLLPTEALPGAWLRRAP